VTTKNSSAGKRKKGHLDQKLNITGGLINEAQVKIDFQRVVHLTNPRDGWHKERSVSLTVFESRPPF
jgi:hypothetical protein